MIEEKFDAIVVGAGMAGNAAALTMAQRGMKVLQLERGEYSGSKNVQGAILYADMLEKLIPNFREDAPLDGPIPEPFRRVTLDDLDHVWLRAYVNEPDIGRVRLGEAVDVSTDSYPGKVYHGRVSFISPQAEFTPKTVETATEHQKLMFRVKAQIAPELLRQHLRQVKTGLPGVAWLKLDADAQWPANLEVKVP